MRRVPTWRELLHPKAWLEDFRRQPEAAWFWLGIAICLLVLSFSGDLP